MSILSTIFAPDGAAEPSQPGAAPAEVDEAGAAQVAPPPDPVLPSEEDAADGAMIGPSATPVPADDFEL